MNDYTKSFTVNNTPGEVYEAITEHITDWWSNDLTGTAAREGDSFNIAFGATHKTFTIAAAVHNKLVVWKCVKAYINMASLTNKSEWVGTKLFWKISTNKTGTTLTFLHEGLNDSFECYSVCENGWNTFLASLQAYLTTGKGKPHLKAAPDKSPEEKQAVG